MNFFQVIGERPLRRITWQCARVMGWFRDVMVMFLYLNLIIRIEVTTGSSLNRTRVTILGIFSHTLLSTLIAKVIYSSQRQLCVFCLSTCELPSNHPFFKSFCTSTQCDKGKIEVQLILWATHASILTRRSRMDISQVHLPVLTHIRFNTSTGANL